MSDRASGEQPFDERAALEELERIQQEIQRYRTKRKTLEEEFERFTASFKHPLPQALPSVTPPPPPPVPPAALGPAALDEPPARAAVEEPPVRAAVENQVHEPLVTEPAPVSVWQLRVPRVRNSMIAGIAGAVLLVAAASYLLWRQATPAEPPSAARVAQGPKTPPGPETKVTPPAPPVQPARHESAVTTTRPVWVRIIADGVPVVERELPANTRLPFVAREKIVIRTGNAGAVRLTIGGVDQGALGGIGEVVTRRFDVPR